MCDYNYIQQGWQCPVCKRVYSPTTTMCYYCGNEKIDTTTTPGETIIDWVKKFSTTFKPEEFAWCNNTRIQQYADMVGSGWTPFGKDKENQDEDN